MPYIEKHNFKTVVFLIPGENTKEEMSVFYENKLFLQFGDTFSKLCVIN